MFAPVPDSATILVVFALVHEDTRIPGVSRAGLRAFGVGDSRICNVTRVGGRVEGIAAQTKDVARNWWY